MEKKFGYGGLSWSAAGGAVLVLIVGFVFGLLHLTSAVDDARAEGLKQVVELRASVCAAQLQSHPEFEAKSVEWGEISSWQRTTPISEFVSTAGLDKMPGEDSPTDGVARACADVVERVL